MLQLESQSVLSTKSGTGISNLRDSDCSSRTLTFSYKGNPMKKIPLSQGKFALVDDEDYEELSKHKWKVQKADRTYYAARGEYIGKARTYKKIYMHRQILSVPKGNMTDHRDGNGLNNQKSNLRKCSNRQNVCNQRPQKNCTSSFKGVYWHRGAKKWESHIVFKGKYRYLGLFEDEIKAAKAYDEAALELFGEYAYANF